MIRITARPSAFRLSRHAAQLLVVLRGEHRGGLVEDEHPRVLAPERLHDLDLLLLAERQRAGADAGGEVDAEQPRELGEARARALEVEPPVPPCEPSMRFSSTLSVGTRVRC